MPNILVYAFPTPSPISTSMFTIITVLISPRIICFFSASKFEELQKLLSQRKAVEESLNNARNRYEKQMSEFKNAQKSFTEAQDRVTKLEKDQEHHDAHVAEVLHSKILKIVGSRVKNMGDHPQLKEQTYPAFVLSKSRHIVEAKIEELNLLVYIYRRWVKLGFGAFETLKRGDRIHVRYVGHDSVLRRDIFLVVPSNEDKSVSPTDETSEESKPFSYLLRRDTWKDESD